MKKFHYAWVIVLVSGVLMFGMSAQQMSAGVFLADVAQSLGVGMGSISFAYSLSTFAMLFMTPLNARLYQRFPTRKLACLAVIDQCASLLILSVATNVWMIAFACLLECFSISSILNVMPSVLIKNWFKDRGSLAYNVILFISMLGGVAFTPIASRIIEAYSWRIAYRTLAVYILAVELPVVLLLLRERPSDIGLTAYEDANESRKNAINARPVMNADATTKSAWHNKHFYLLCVYSIALSYSATMQNHLVKHLSGLGYAASLGATAVTAGLVGGLVGRVILGYLGERFSSKTTNMLYCTIGIIAAIGLCNAGKLNETMIIVMGFLFGMATKVSTVQMTVVRYKVFGASDDYTLIIANMHICTNIITATSGTVYGTIFDLTGSYTAGFMLSIATFALAILLLYVILKSEGRKRHKPVESNG